MFVLLLCYLDLVTCSIPISITMWTYFYKNFSLVSCRQLNSDVDMMMKDLLPEFYDKPADSLNLKADNEASLHQREKVTGEVDVLLEQIQNMHQGFISMKNAGRKPRTHTRYNSLGVVSPLHSSTSQKDIVHTRCPSGPSLHTAMVFWVLFLCYFKDFTDYFIYNCCVVCIKHYQRAVLDLILSQ